MSEETAAPAAEAPRKAGIGGLIIALAVITAIGGAAGGYLGFAGVDVVSAAATRRANEVPKADAKALAWDKETTVARLNPVITNLASPPGARVRMDTAMVFDVEGVEDVERMKAVLADEVLNFMHTVSLGELTGASALGHLRDDLNERVRSVSAGAVHELLIESLVLQ